MDEITIETELITPALAEHWLAQNQHNRTLDRIKVGHYAHAMESGDWALNGESIKFDGPAGLLDGQHRLAACVRSGVSFQSLVIRGLPPEAQETIDRGKGRTIGDILTLRGEKSAVTLAAALVWLYRLEMGVQRSNAIAMSAQDALRLLDANPGLREMGPLAEPMRRTKLLSVSMTWALAYKFSRLDWDDAVDFFRKLGDGAGLEEDDPILRLRNLLIQEMSLQRGRRTHAWIIAGSVIKAWNFYRDGTAVKALRMRTGGSRPETFPDAR